MLFDPSEWLANFMQLTEMSWDFRGFILALGIGYIFLAWTSEQYVFPELAKYLGFLQTWITGTPKKRETYELVLDEMHSLQ